MSRIPNDPLVETEWLPAHLDDSTIRIFDCTVTFRNNENCPTATNGRLAYDQGHIPGSAFMDLTEDLSAKNASFPFTMPSAEQTNSALGSLGVGNERTVVLYDHAEDLWANKWAARAWWILRVYGFHQAHVLNGSLYKWRKEGGQISQVPSTYPATQFMARLHKGTVVERQGMLDAIGNPNTSIINAPTPEDFSGASNRYGRPGHIPQSFNVPTVDLIDPVTHAYLPKDRLQAIFAPSGAINRDNAITYCGAGISVATAALPRIRSRLPAQGAYQFAHPS